MARPPEYDLDKEADDLLAWSLRDDALSLYQFTDPKPYPTQDLFDFARRNASFGLALKKAKNRIAIRREQKCNSGELNTTVYAKTIHNYDTTACDHDEYKKDKDADRKIRITKEELKARAELGIGDAESNQKLADFVGLVSQIQSRSERKMAANKSSADTKS